MLRVSMSSLRKQALNKYSCSAIPASTWYFTFVSAMPKLLYSETERWNAVLYEAASAPSSGDSCSESHKTYKHE